MKKKLYAVLGLKNGKAMEAIITSTPKEFLEAQTCLRNPTSGFESIYFVDLEDDHLSGVTFYEAINALRALNPLTDMRVIDEMFGTLICQVFNSARE